MTRFSRLLSFAPRGAVPRGVHRIKHIRALSTTPPRPEAGSASKVAAIPKLVEWFNGFVKPYLPAAATVLTAAGLVLAKMHYDQQTPQYKLAQAKKCVEAAFNRPAVPIDVAAEGEAEIIKDKRSNRPDVIFDQTNVCSIPMLQWNKEELKKLMLKAGIVFLFKPSKSGKTTSIKAMVDALNGYKDADGDVHRFLFVPLRQQKGGGPTGGGEGACMPIADTFANSCGISSEFKDYAYDGFVTFVEENQGKGVIYHLVLDDVQAALREPAFKQWNAKLSGLIASESQRLILIGSEDVESILKAKVSGASTRLKAPNMPTPTEDEVAAYLTKTIGLSDGQAKQFITEVGCYMGFITEFVSKLLPEKYKIGKTYPILDTAYVNEHFDAAIKAATKVIEDTLATSKDNLLETPGGKAAWEAYKGASATFSKEVDGKNMDPQELKKKRRAILTSVLMKNENSGFAKMLTHAKLIVKTGGLFEPEYDWYFPAFAKLAHKVKEQ